MHPPPAPLPRAHPARRLRPWNPSRGSIGWFGFPLETTTTTTTTTERVVASCLCLAFALPCLASLALPCLAFAYFLACLACFFFLLVSRSPNSYRPARRVHAQFCLIF